MPVIVDWDEVARECYGRATAALEAGEPDEVVARWIAAARAADAMPEDAGDPAEPEPVASVH